MGLMDKIKNLFTEEVEEEIEEVEEPIKKEMIQVEIPSPVKQKSILEEVEEDKIKKETSQEDFKFPFFDDDDFHEMEEEKPKEELKRKKIPKREPKEVYSPVKEEKKVFKPTPIISPVYGILDKNYQKEDIRTKTTKPRSYYNPKEVTLDEIRNKAYGTLEDDLETTLFGRNRVLFDDIPKEETNKSLDEIEKEAEVLDLKKPKEEYDNDIIGERPRHGSSKEPDLTDLLQAELGKEESEEKPKKISDSELFDMIDSMYQKGDKQ